LVLEIKPMPEWWEKNFATCELGDLRLNKRAREIGQVLSQGLARRCQRFWGANALKQAYEFCQHKD
jgi:hypothetical protein